MEQGLEADCSGGTGRSLVRWQRRSGVGRTTRRPCRPGVSARLAARSASGGSPRWCGGPLRRIGAHRGSGWITHRALASALCAVFDGTARRQRPQRCGTAVGEGDSSRGVRRVAGKAPVDRVHGACTAGAAGRAVPKRDEPLTGSGMQQARTFRAEKTVGVAQNHEDGTGLRAVAGLRPKRWGGNTSPREWTLESMSVEGTPANPRRGARSTSGQGEGEGSGEEPRPGRPGARSARDALADGLRNTSRAHPATGERQEGAGKANDPLRSSPVELPRRFARIVAVKVATSRRDGFHEP